MAWPYYAPMQHPGQHHVVHVARPARELSWQVEARRARADHAVLGGRLLRRVARDVRRELQVPVRGRAAFLQQRAQLRARLAQRLAALGDRLAARGHALVRAVRSARRPHADLLQRHAELLGRDLRQRGQDALAELDLAARDRHRAVAFEVHPLRQAARVGQRGGLLSEHRGSPSPRGCASRSGKGSCRASHGFLFPKETGFEKAAQPRS